MESRLELFLLYRSGAIIVTVDSIYLPTCYSILVPMLAKDARGIVNVARTDTLGDMFI